MCFSQFGASGFLNLVLGFSWQYCNGGFLGGVVGFFFVWISWLCCSVFNGFCGELLMTVVVIVVVVVVLFCSGLWLPQ